ncbi:hypothetical protein MXB_2251 [Myxobolus squamalis]|nr:hypothetical protein MXB_2251 [Myxobolus squamalis]
MAKIPTGHLLSRIRELFLTCNSKSPINAYIVLSNDCHMSEYTSEFDKRRKFISGFDGSAGSVVITNSEALLWTDSRYFLQAESCLDENWKLMKSGLPGIPTMLEWLKKMPKNSIVGTDPNYITYRNLLVAIKENLVDIVWKEHGRKPELLSKPYIYGLKFSGSITNFT